MNVQRAESAVKLAWMAAVFTAIINVILTIVYLNGFSLEFLAAWTWIDILLTLVLAFGIYKKSRISAGILLLYYPITKIIFWLDERVIIGLPVAIIFTYIFFQGFRGTLIVHEAEANTNLQSATS